MSNLGAVHFVTISKAWLLLGLPASTRLMHVHTQRFLPREPQLHPTSRFLLCFLPDLNEGFSSPETSESVVVCGHLKL